VGSAARRIRCVHSFKVGLEQQLHHIERRALGGGVVKGQLFVLRTRRAAQHCGVACGPNRVRELERSRRAEQGQSGGAAAVIVKRVGSAARLILRSDGIEVGVEQQLHHIERHALGGGVVQGQLPVLRSAVHGVALTKDHTQGRTTHTV
jgi:hypothetical protein